MIEYNIWRIAGGAKTWVISNAKGSSPEAALRAEALSRRYGDLYGDGEVFIVAARTGGHGHADVFKLRRTDQTVDDSFVKTVTV